ncbi:MAG: 3',5'-cyclic-nucleotide phosphodiesterase [Betaproteobacteria bacterium]|nr:3',5'-cyclic-nucleotide phosphodiesterase [Betaproteobacteria bacterium]
MKVEVLGCSGGLCKGHDTTCLRINDSILLDAGTGAGNLAIPEAVKIRDILISHSHLDHVSSICFLSDQDIETRSQPTRIYCLPETSNALTSDLVNGQLWPEIEKVVINGVNMVEFVPVKPFERIVIGDCEFTPLPVEHAVPTVGYCLHGEEADMVFISDMISAPQEVYDWILSRKRVKYFITEAAFPNRLVKIAHISKHMTPEMMIESCRPLVDLPGIEFYATHIKPIYVKEVVDELAESADLPVKILKQGDCFEI